MFYISYEDTVIEKRRKSSVLHSRGGNMRLTSDPPEGQQARGNFACTEVDNNKSSLPNAGSVATSDL